MKEIHLRLAEIGLRVAGRYGFALAGGYAVQVHGILDRPSEDVDLFTAWERRGEFAVAVDAVVDAYRVDGYIVEIMQRFDTFARLGSPILRYRIARTRSNLRRTGVPGRR